MLNIAANLLLLAAQARTEARSFEDSNFALDGVKLNKGNYAQVCYLRAVNYFATNDRVKALEWLDLLDGSFDVLPERYKAMSALMRASLEAWKNGLDDTARLMGRSSDRLQNAKADELTKQIQEKILKNLDEQIDETERPQASKSATQSTDPMPPKHEADIPPINGQGKVDTKRLDELRESWGKLPEKERAKAMITLTKDLPPRYRVIIEQYEQALGRHRE